MKFRAGDRIHLVNKKGRHYPLNLASQKVFQFSGEVISHDEIIGKEEGTTITLSRGKQFIALKPSLKEYILKMPRGAQVIYPKDIGIILMWGDIYPGAKVVEAGLGSGALTMALLRSVGREGMVISYEIREDFIKRGIENIECYMGKVDNLIVKRQDIYEGIDEEDVDRIILDLPEPWRVVEHAVRVLRNGGIFLCYLPTILQVANAVEALRKSGRFIQIETLETLLRTWHVEDKSVRPDHRMVAHTGFIITGRKVERAWNP